MIKWICWWLLLSPFAFAQVKSLAATTTGENHNSKTQVLDFNADVIEGELKRPQLFLELGGKITDVDAVLLTRESFNDYHAVDMRKRLRYVEKKSRQ